MTRRLAAVLVAVVAFAGFPACSRDGITVTAVFDDVGDLQPRHSVQVADVRVGSIAAVELRPDFRAEVTMRIGAGQRIPRASVALLRTTSLLGEKFVEIRSKGDPATGPFLRDGDVIDETAEAPELEFVAEQAITVLSGVVSTDVATLVDTGAEAFGGRGEELRALIENLGTISATLASRTTEIQRIIDGLDTTTRTLAGGSDQIATLLTNLAGTTTVLADNRERAVAALRELSRLARVQSDVLDRYRADIERQITQVDAILAVAAGQTAELSLLVDWLNRFVAGSPQAIPGDFAQVFGWFVDAAEDDRPHGPAGNNQP